MPAFLPLVLLLALPALAASCPLLTRVDRESYDCPGAAGQPGFTLVLPRLRQGAEARFVPEGGAEHILTLRALSDTHLDVAGAGMSLSVHRGDGRIAILSGSTLRSHDCRKARFRM
ncbi:hypothetical protein ACFQXB_05345 [Plastorhodobacter daqingensis]|uniref:C-type lysozyme inhibitor domain-containing protein n=1 Tax=Plastorhodobacter daqingensis TaxID=1387281 RepID=A0ABW2UG21_9RHOB